MAGEVADRTLRWIEDVDGLLDAHPDWGSLEYMDKRPLFEQVRVVGFLIVNGPPILHSVFVQRQGFVVGRRHGKLKVPCHRFVVVRMLR